MEKEKYDSISYISKMFIGTVIWLIVVYIVSAGVENYPHKVFTIDYNESTSFSFDLRDTVALLIVLISQYIIFAKCKIYSYCFDTDCKSPVISLILNIVFGSIVCLFVPLFVPFENTDISFVAKAFIVMAVINYLLFYAKYGYKFEERDYVEDWHKTIHQLPDAMGKK